MLDETTSFSHFACQYWNVNSGAEQFPQILSPSLYLLGKKNFKGQKLFHNDPFITVIPSDAP